ncbi:aromatic-L-amino-acid decarboxylase isoform X1 [Frankliniella occidentalis]|uniref:Aromatic-L-amino-acid decarboxylase isoform X1 n=1 Tax=Frankliniella occidentalis TaxID=133901 RepID=A0A9C6X1U1_FRAOC|nr:aromatic-L-amino-acid decarboxylase isoform X1 [Frankliniella occidentalis]XP_052127614.1 aromatic-L-amino-acid decarboxylase isoform X1 [Frankliniella occidentalis]
MDSNQFRVRGQEMVEYICRYLEELPERRVVPSVEPGYLKHLIPKEAPENGEAWEDIMADVESKIMPGVTHWQHPRFHAYFPSGNSYPSILGDMLSDAIGCIGFSWAASPACTELETIVLDWLGKAIGLPVDFLAFAEGSKGGGVIQTSASECVLVCMLAARAQAIKRLKLKEPGAEEGVLLGRLMAYCSKESHSCVEKAAMISFVKLRILEPDQRCSLRGPTLRQAMEEDEAAGLVPFFVSTTLGTTSCCSFDNLMEIGPVCRRFPSVWLHVDGAYAGNSFICPELKSLLDGVQYADSFNTNPNKWLLVSFDCSCLWVRDRLRLTSALVVDPLYLQHGYSESTIDYRHWGVPLSRRFRALKLWFVMRTYGIEGLRQYIRHHIKLAKSFEARVLKDPRFEVCNEVKLGLVCFRLRGTDQLNMKLLSSINASGRLHMVPATVVDKYIIRFCVTAQNATEEDVEHAWQVITEVASSLLGEMNGEPPEIMDDRKRRETLAYKRSFFVRMVSDPKIYNPKIAKAVPGQRRLVSSEADIEDIEEVENDEPEVESASNITIQKPIATWISWPLEFLFQGVFDEAHHAEVPVSLCDRFRHLDTMVRLKARRGSSSPSPEYEPRDDSGGSGGSGSVSPTSSTGPAPPQPAMLVAVASPRRSPAFPRKLHFGRSSQQAGQELDKDTK